MSHKFILLLMVFSVQGLAIQTPVLTQAPDTKAPWIVRAYYKHKDQVQNLSSLADLWTINQQQHYAVLLIDNAQTFDKVKSLGLSIRIDNKLQQQYFRDLQKITSSNNKGSNVISGFSCYSTVEGSFIRMQDMVLSHPDLAEIVDIGDSWEKTINNLNGYDLKVLKITNQQIVEDKPKVFITSAIHAREYTTAELTTRFAEMLLAQYTVNADVKWMLDHQELHLLIQTNPDGRKKAETGILWRKNTNQAYCAPTSNNRGADLNRNYSYFWEAGNNQCSEVYPGPMAQSEPEIGAVITYLKQIYVDNRGDSLVEVVADDVPGVFLDIHSFSQLILWPWGLTSNPAPNVGQLAAFGRRVAFYNSYTPEPVSDLTIAKGGSIDTSYGELGVASLAFELGTAFFQDCATFESTILPTNLQALMYVNRVARKPYELPLGPDIENLQIVPNFILANQATTVTGIANDDRYNHSHGAQSFASVQNIDLFIDDLPWLGLNATSVNAADGTFDSSAETFTTNVDTTSLSVGQHTLYVVATDTDNKKGGVYAQFLHVVEGNTVGTISGRVTDAITGQVIDQSMLTFNNSSNRSDASGQYSLLAPVATDDLHVSANGYVNKIVPNLTVTQQQDLNQNIQLEPFCSIVEDDVENGNGMWTSTSNWAISTEKSSSPTHAWSDSPNANYGNNTNTSITSNDISIVGADSLQISFNHWCETESGFDFGHVEINFDNSLWQEILSCSGASSWKHEALTVAIPNNAKQLKLRFRLSSDGSLTDDGWYVDDVLLKVTGQPCRGVFDDMIFTNGFD
ncbi:MAG TPA: hypothetical protein ENJ41_02660 [Oceanospirillales bacterium]|nr:hypothetical protein [Oceanospirillales bacterium]